jgi:PilZ domain
MATAIERRREVRYQLRAPVILRSVDDQMAKPEAGFVQNISIEGVLVWCPHLPSVGNLIELEILLPPFGTGTHNPSLLARYTGLVVRLENEDRFAVAARASLHRYIMGSLMSIPDEES